MAVGTVPSGATTLTNAQLQALWISQGGPASAAPEAAAIAQAESSGYNGAYNSTDPSGGSFGLWQINGAHLGEPGVPSNYPALYDPTTNAAAAVAVYKAAGNSFSPWSTAQPGPNGQPAAYTQYLTGPAALANMNWSQILSDSVLTGVSTAVLGATPIAGKVTGTANAATNPFAGTVATVQSWGTGIAIFLIGLVIILGGLFMASGTNVQTVIKTASKALPEAA